MMVKNNKGITLVSLSAAIIILMIVVGVLIYNSGNHVKMDKLDGLYNDIDSLNAKISDYYTKYGSLPTLCEYFNNKNDFKQILQNNANSANITIASIDDKLNPNDNDNYYVIDLKKLEALSLHYGYNDDYKKIEENGNEITSYDVEDEIYVINETSHQIYFPHGIVVDNDIHFWKTLDTEISFTGDANLYYTVSFNVGDAEPIEDQLIRPGEKSQQPEDPVVEDRGFLGWYYLEQGGTEEEPTFTEREFDFDTHINQDYMVYAKYTGEAIMMAKDNNTAFWQSTYRTNITNIKFTKDSDDIPASYVQSWNVKADENCADVMAYLTGTSPNYSLIIYSPYTIYSNYNSYAYFAGFTKLSSINFTNYSTSKVTKMRQMFFKCSELMELNISNFDTSKVTDMYMMFSECSKLTELDLRNFNTSNVTTMYYMFDRCVELTELDVSGLNTSNVINMRGMFFFCKKLAELDVSGFDTSQVTTMYSMFDGCSRLIELDVSNFDTSKVTEMTYMFRDCSGLTKLNLNGFDTSKVEDMGFMFYNCSGLTKLDLNGFKTSKVIDMQNMFYNCSGLTKLDLSGFDTSKVTNMSYMFNACRELTSLDVSKLNTSSVENMYRMFCNCNKVTSLDVSGFDTGNVNNMYMMFYNCEELTELNVRGFDISKVTTVYYMFGNCLKLKTIYCNNNWYKENITSTGMFSRCSKLKGAISYNSGKININYANPDTGYFTRKTTTP